jgi:zona occludens toxin
MAIMAYIGVMGSGKTYEGVSTASLNALKCGRRVVTNIAGFNFQAIRDHLGQLSDGSHLEPDKIVVVPSKRITEPHFFFDPETNAESVVKPGDLVLIDEVWSFWGTDAKLSPEHQKFFRMHRHYTEEGSGTSCDLVIMIQDLTSLHRFIRGVLESTFKFTKMKTLGLSSRYRVEVYEGNRQRKATLVSASVKKYDAKIFPLYKSYDSGAGKEAVVDDRQNLFKNTWFVGVMIASLVGLGWSAWWFAGWVGHMRSGGADSAKDKAQVTTQQSAQAVRSQGSTPLTAAAAAPVEVAKDTRLVAVVEPAAGETVVVFQTSEGRYVRQRMNAGLIDGWQTMAGYQGRMVGFSFGGKPR